MSQFLEDVTTVQTSEEYGSGRSRDQIKTPNHERVKLFKLLKDI